MDKQKEFTYANGENFVVGYGNRLVTNTLVFNPEDANQSAILLIGRNQIDLRREVPWR